MEAPVKHGQTFKESLRAQSSGFSCQPIRGKFCLKVRGPSPHELKLRCCDKRPKKTDRDCFLVFQSKNKNMELDMSKKTSLLISCLKKSAYFKTQVKQRISRETKYKNIAWLKQRCCSSADKIFSEPKNVKR